MGINPRTRVCLGMFGDAPVHRIRQPEPVSTKTGKKAAAKGSTSKKGGRRYEDSGDEDDDTLVGADTEEVLGLGVDDDIDGEDWDEEDEDEDAELSDSDVAVTPAKQREISDKAWGRHKQVYYDADLDKDDEDGTHGCVQR